MTQAIAPAAGMVRIQELMMLATTSRRRLFGRRPAPAPITGMAAQAMGASVIQVATQLGFPVSTTHTITGAVERAPPFPT